MTTLYDVAPQMHDDERFVALSTEAQMLWVVFLTGPQRSSLPGLQRADLLSLAAIRRRNEAIVKDALHEIVQLGMAKHDTTKRVLLMPRFVNWVPNPNRNMLIGWKKRWDEIPDCGLKFEWLELLKWGFEPTLQTAAGDVKRGWSETFAKVRQRRFSGVAPGGQGTLTFSEPPGQSTLRDTASQSALVIPIGTVPEPFANSFETVREGFEVDLDQGSSGSKYNNHPLHVATPSAGVSNVSANGSETIENENENENGDEVASEGSGRVGGVRGGREGSVQYERNETPGQRVEWANESERRRLEARKADWLRR